MHVESYNRNTIKRMIAEHEREAKSYKSEVDPTRSHLNFHISMPRMVGFDKKTVYERALSRCHDILGEKGYAKMKGNTNIMSEWDLSYPKELCDEISEDTGKVYKKNVRDKVTKEVIHKAGDPIIKHYFRPKDMEQCKQFFTIATQMLIERYGKENFLGAYVHMDETTPHLHFDFVPEAISRKTGNRTISSASLLTRFELSGKKGKDGNGVHYDLQQKMIAEFGEQASEWILNGATEGNYTTAELKARKKTMGVIDKKKEELLKYTEELEQKYQAREEKLHAEEVKLEYDKVAFEKSKAEWEDQKKKDKEELKQEMEAAYDKLKKDQEDVFNTAKTRVQEYRNRLQEKRKDSSMGLSILDRKNKLQNVSDISVALKQAMQTAKRSTMADAELGNIQTVDMKELQRQLSL